MALEFNIARYFADRGLKWDAVQSLLEWPKDRRHALRRFVEGTGRLSLQEVNDLLQYVHDHCPNWVDYLFSPNVLQLMSETGRVRMYVVGGTQANESRDHSSMFDLLALSYVNANLPRTSWRPVRFDIEPCQMSWVRRENEARRIASVEAQQPAEWKLSFGSSKVSLPTTLLLEQIYGPDPAHPPAAEPIVFRLCPSPHWQRAQTRFIETVTQEHEQGIAIAGGKPFLYVPPGAEGRQGRGKDVSLIVCQAAPEGSGGRVIIAGVSGPGTYAAALALVQHAELFAPARAASLPNGKTGLGRFDPTPIVAVVEADVAQEANGSGARFVIGARLVYCSAQPTISSAAPVVLAMPQ